MVLAYHVPLANYGFWLPNDERGSGSDFVRNKALLKFGAAKKLTTRRSTARAPHNFDVRRLAKDLLRYPAVEFNEQQVDCSPAASRKSPAKKASSSTPARSSPDISTSSSSGTAT